MRELEENTNLFLILAIGKKRIKLEFVNFFYVLEVLDIQLVCFTSNTSCTKMVVLLHKMGITCTLEIMIVMSQ